MTPEKRLEYAMSMISRNDEEAKRELIQVIDEVAPGGVLQYPEEEGRRGSTVWPTGCLRS